MQQQSLHGIYVTSAASSRAMRARLAGWADGLARTGTQSGRGCHLESDRCTLWARTHQKHNAEEADSEEVARPCIRWHRFVNSSGSIRPHAGSQPTHKIQESAGLGELIYPTRKQTAPCSEMSLCQNSVPMTRAMKMTCDSCRITRWDAGNRADSCYGTGAFDASMATASLCRSNVASCQQVCRALLGNIAQRLLHAALDIDNADLAARRLLGAGCRPA